MPKLSKDSDSDLKGEARKKGKPRGFRRDRDCFKCKERQVKCDLNRPSCSQCISEGIKCTGYQSRVIWFTTPDGKNISRGMMTKAVINLNTDARKPSKASLPNSANSLEPNNVLTDELDPSETHEWQFVNTPASSSIEIDHCSSPPKLVSSSSPKYQSAPEQFSTFESVRAPTSSNFSWGINAISIAFDHAKQQASTVSSHSSYHLSAENAVSELKHRIKILSAVWKFVLCYVESSAYTDREFDYYSLKVKSQAIEELKVFIGEGSLESLFAILAFSYFDVSQESFGQWSRHLTGARSLLDLHCSNFEELESTCNNLPGLRHAVTLFNWYDVMGSMVSGRDLVFEHWHRKICDPSFFSLVGCPIRTFYRISDIVGGTSDCKTLFVESLTEIIPHSGVSDEDKVGLIYKYVSLVLTAEQHFGEIEAQNELTRQLVQRVCDLLDEIPLDSQYSLHLASCVFSVAVRAKEAQLQHIISKYWTHWSTANFPLYKDALEQCQRVWHSE